MLRCLDVNPRCRAGDDAAREPTDIHVAASPRLVPAKYPRRGRGVAATCLRKIRPAAAPTERRPNVDGMVKNHAALLRPLRVATARRVTVGASRAFRQGAVHPETPSTFDDPRRRRRAPKHDDAPRRPGGRFFLATRAGGVRRRRRRRHRRRRPRHGPAADDVSRIVVLQVWPFRRRVAASPRLRRCYSAETCTLRTFGRDPPRAPQVPRGRARRRVRGRGHAHVLLERLRRRL